MRTMCRRLILASLGVTLLLAPRLQGAAQAQVPCGNPAAPAPQCDAYCPPGQACVDTGGDCSCVPTAGPCGVMAGPPQCWGDCPPSMPVCVDNAGVCTCVVPTLSEWGIIGMSIVMFGSLLYLRRRQEDDCA